MATGRWSNHIKISLEEKKKRNCDRTKAFNRLNPDKQRNNKLMKAYGITSKEYDDFSVFCGGLCGVCGNKCPSGRRLAVDHDHTNGVIRGLLCINCNKGLGNFKDNKKLLLNAVEYLDLYKECLGEYNAVNKGKIRKIVSKERGGRNELRKAT